MKINDRNPIHSTSNKERTPTSKPKGNPLFSLFTSELKDKLVELDSYEQDVESMRKQINIMGAKLETEPTLPNFKQFRDLLGRLAKRISTEAYRLEKVGGTPANPRYYEIITVIDREADKLYHLVVKEQKDRMAITATVIGIKGLVVDLTT